MRKLTVAIGLVATVLSVMVAAAPPSTAAAPPSPASGTGTITSTSTTVLRTADGNTIAANGDAGTVAGSLTGTWETEYTVIVHSSGQVNAVHGTFTCSCSFEGRSGSATFRFEGTASPSGLLELNAETIGGTGGLAGLHSNLTVEVVFGTGFTYSGTARFAP
jgi:uncharacterized Zn-binding protein involved in type VI secretion